MKSYNTLISILFTILLSLGCSDSVGDQVEKDLTISEQFEVMRIMYGGHVDEYDYHLMGFTKEFLSQYMKDAGFENIKKVDNFGLFKDTSTLTFKDVPISLNITATKLSK